jgi:hypothetical protein
MAALPPAFRTKKDGMTWRGLACAMILPALFMLASAAVGSNGPTVLLLRRPGPDSVGIDFSDSVMTTCTTEADGSARAALIPRCYSHFFVFTSRWTQYFDLQLAVGPPTSASGRPFSSKMPLRVEWYGQEATGSWVKVVDGVVLRPLECDAGGYCWPVQVFRTSVVAYSSYFARVSIAMNATSDSAVRALIGPSSDVLFRYRNPSFAMWELGFKAALLTLNLAVITWFAWASGWPGCGTVRYASLRCCRAFVSSRWSSPTSRLGFQNEARVGWTLALLIGLLAFNEPLLWATYYAPYTPDGTVRADALPFLNLAGQVTFVLLLCAFWIVEFGLLAARAGVVRIIGVEVLPPPAATAPVPAQGTVEGGINVTPGGEAPVAAAEPPEPPATPVTPFAFYAPKMTVVVLFWLLSLGIYGTILRKSAGDPLYDWIAEGTDTAKAVGAGAVDTRFALAVATLIAGAAYATFLSYLGFRSLFTCRRMSGSDRFLFAFHYIVLLATTLGLVGGSIVAADVSSPSDLLFFSALFNVYGWTLAYLNAPEEAPSAGRYGAIGAIPASPTAVEVGGVREGEVHLDVKGVEAVAVMDAAPEAVSPGKAEQQLATSVANEVDLVDIGVAMVVEALLFPSVVAPAVAEPFVATTAQVPAQCALPTARGAAIVDWPSGAASVTDSAGYAEVAAEAAVDLPAAEDGHAASAGCGDALVDAIPAAEATTDEFVVDNPFDGEAAARSAASVPFSSPFDDDEGDLR